MVRIFVISDTHFGHENIYKFTGEDGKRIRQEFADAKEGDAEMIRRWNEIVTDQDHVWHLGDFTMGNNLWTVKLLKGHKRLILGNHDKCDVRAYREAGFQKVQGYKWHEKFILSHVPIHPEGLYGGRINVHGHIHEKPPYDERYRNVSVERIDYRPVLLDSLKP